MSYIEHLLLKKQLEEKGAKVTISHQANLGPVTRIRILLSPGLKMELTTSLRDPFGYVTQHKGTHRELLVSFLKEGLHFMEESKLVN